MINRIQYSCSCIIEFIKLVASLAFYLFSPTRLINSIKHEHSCKILYIIWGLSILSVRPYPSMPEIKVNKEDVTKLLHKLNPSKASGPDLIPARILKELAVEIAPFLTTIFQESFNTGTVPRDWRIANVTAIFKKGEKYKASNYRPVSLTSLCCKVQEHITRGPEGPEALT